MPNNLADENSIAHLMEHPPTHTYIHWQVAIPIKVLIYSLLNQNPTKGTRSKSGWNIKHNSIGRFRNARSSSLTRYKLFF